MESVNWVSFGMGLSYTHSAFKSTKLQYSVFHFVFFTNRMASIAKSIVKKTEGAIYPSRCITRTT